MSTRRPEDARLLSNLVAGGVLLLLSLLASLVVAAPARAHTGLVEATPSAGATVEAPAQLVLTFSEEVVASLAAVGLQAPSGPVELPGSPEVSGRRVVQDLGTLEAGEHVVRYRVVAGDGHPVTGETSFTVRAAAPRATGSSTAAPAAAAPLPPSAAASTVSLDGATAVDGGGPSLRTAATGALLVGLGAAALVARRRAAPRSEMAGRG